MRRCACVRHAVTAAKFADSRLLSVVELRDLTPYVRSPRLWIAPGIWPRELGSQGRPVADRPKPHRSPMPLTVEPFRSGRPA
jgi:hypothetical protein